MKQVTRRDFLLGAAGAVTSVDMAAQPLRMQERPLGRTGHQVRLFSLGGQAALEQPGQRDEALKIINRAIDLGVNYLDTAPKYGDGLSQRTLGEVIAKRRREVFLASKTHERGSRDASLRLLDESLKALRTDYLDLWQIHNVREEAHLVDIFKKGGSLEALTQARDQKMVRHLGITGHYDPLVLLKAIERFDFDCLLMPVNPADRHPLLLFDRFIPHANRNRLSFLERLIPAAGQRNIGIIGMKVTARGRVFKQPGIGSMEEALGYALTCPVSTVIVGCDTVAQLEANIRIASSFRPLSSVEMAQLEGKTKPYAWDAAYFKRGGAGEETNQ